MPRARSRQIDIVFSTRGGRRRGAGRKPTGLRAGVSHATRPFLSGREAVLITMKVRREIWSLRTRRAFSKLLPALFAACERFGMRLVQFSVQHDHLHLVVEAIDRVALSRGVQGLAVRIARRINRLMGRKGKVFADRYHERVLRTPRQVRTALAYVLCNARKHGVAPPIRGWLDPFSSAPAFAHWTAGLDRAPPLLPVAVPRTWLLARGWLRGGTLDRDHCPGALPR